MTNKLDKLLAAAEAATPGPWLSQREQGSGEYTVWTRQPHTGTLASIHAEDINGNFPAEANAAFIALANPQTITQLIRAYTAMREALETTRDYVQDTSAGHLIGTSGGDLKLMATEDVKTIEAALDLARTLETPE